MCVGITAAHKKTAVFLCACVCVREVFTRGCPCIAAYMSWHFSCFYANHHVLHLLLRAYGGDCSVLHAWGHRRRHHRLQHSPPLLQQLQPEVLAAAVEAEQQQEEEDAVVSLSGCALPLTRSEEHTSELQSHV